MTEQGKFDYLTRKWWFFLFVILLQFVPSYASKGFDPAEAGLFVGETLSHALAYDCPSLFPIFKVIPIILIVSIIFLKTAVTRVFSVYAGITFLLFAVLQSVAITEKYGLGIITGNLIMFSLVAIFWFWEALVRKNDFASPKQVGWRYWVVPFAFLAFWYPLTISEGSMIPDFNPVGILTNEAGLAFCLMTPVYLAVLTLYHPKINLVTLRVTSLVGIIIGIYNVLVNFILAFSTMWWNGVLHIPLLTISAYGLVLSFRRRS